MNRKDRRRVVRNQRDHKMHTSGTTPQYFGIPSNAPGNAEKFEILVDKVVIDAIGRLTQEQTRAWMMQWYAAYTDLLHNAMEQWPDPTKVPDGMVDPLQRAFMVEKSFMQALGLKLEDEDGQDHAG